MSHSSAENGHALARKLLQAVILYCKLLANWILVQPGRNNALRLSVVSKLVLFTW